MPWKELIQRESGSYFHWIKSEVQERLIQEHPADFNEAYLTFYSGRHALKYLISQISIAKTVRKIWMPRYYCQHVTKWMQKNYSNLDFYDSLPFECSNPFVIPEQVSGDDILIINNYWGICNLVREKRQKQKPIIIEDHSHGWLSRQSLNSNADYCFVSLRKSLPVPLGGICWKPGGSLPRISLPQDQLLYETWDLMSLAMQNKSKFLKGDETIEKSRYLGQIADVEHVLDQSHIPIRTRTEDEDFISKWIGLDVRAIKEERLQYCYAHLSDTSQYKVIKRSGYTTFGLMLLFWEEKSYDSFRSFLISREIFMSNLWPDNEDWKYFLNVHVDFRYGKEHLDHIIDTITSWTKRNC